ncbi:MAG: hypothetical protein Q8K62_01765 [Thiobacillus sp.]|nr:hypothetical protein [Thiobacillus sp.]
MPLLKPACAATWMLGSLFFFSAVMNHVRPRHLGRHQPFLQRGIGAAHSVELFRDRAAVDLIMMAAFYYLARTIRELAGLQLAEALKH